MFIFFFCTKVQLSFAKRPLSYLLGSLMYLLTYQGQLKYLLLDLSISILKTLYTKVKLYRKIYLRKLETFNLDPGKIH